MKNLISYALNYRTLKELAALEYSVTSQAFFTNKAFDFFGEPLKEQSIAKKFETLLNKLPLKLKIEKISHINCYVDQTTTDEPILYSGYKDLSFSFNNILSAYLSNIMATPDITQEQKLLTLSKVNQQKTAIHSPHLESLIRYWSLNCQLEPKSHHKKSKKI